MHMLFSPHFLFLNVLGKSVLLRFGKMTIICAWYVKHYWIMIIIQSKMKVVNKTCFIFILQYTELNTIILGVANINKKKTWWAWKSIQYIVFTYQLFLMCFIYDFCDDITKERYKHVFQFQSRWMHIKGGEMCKKEFWSSF